MAKREREKMLKLSVINRIANRNGRKKKKIQMKFFCSRDLTVKNGKEFLRRLSWYQFTRKTESLPPVKPQLFFKSQSQLEFWSKIKGVRNSFLPVHLIFISL